jgi:hypothetical protein
MAGVVLVGFPFLTGQVVGSCVDVVLVRAERSIWPFHAASLGLGLAVGFGWRTEGTDHHGAPTANDYNKVMIVTLFVGLATSFVTFGFWRLMWLLAQNLREETKPLFEHAAH